MTEDEKRYVLFGFGLIAGSMIIFNIRMHRLVKEFRALRDDYLDHIESEYQDVVDEAFEEIVENYDEP
jgi:flagellar biosynthesis/type III secretory pathway protein FliH